MAGTTIGTYNGGGTALGSLLSGMFGIGITRLNQDYAEDMARQDRRENYEYGEKAAENAFKRQQLMTEMYMTPEAQIRHLENAGLSPSLMYGAGGGTQGVSAPQGTGASGPQTPTFGFDPNMMLTMAQIGQVMAQTEKTKAETETEKGENALGAAKIAELLSLKGMHDASTQFTESETKINELQSYIMDKTKFFEISKAESMALEAEQSAIQAMYKAQEEGLNFELSVETYDEAVKQAELNVKLMASEISKNVADINLKQTEIYQIVENVKLAYREQLVKENAFTLEENKYNFDKFKWTKEMELDVEKFNKNLHFQAHKAKVDAITGLVGRAFSFFVGASVLKTSAQGNPTVTGKYEPIKVPNGFEGFKY